MRSPAIVVDWNVFFGLGLDGPDVELWSRYPLEIDASTIVTPHLYAIRRGSRAPSSVACTIAQKPLFVVFAHRTAAHRDYLMNDVVPRLVCKNVAIVDTNARVFDVPGAGQRDSLARLPERLADWSAFDALAAVDFIDRLDRYEESFGRSAQQVDSRIAERLERTPLRLWEVLFHRGHAYRYELLDGEVVIVSDLGSRAAANRTAMQCIRDAEALCSEAARDEYGWFRAGRFRIRDRGSLLELRAELDAADIRVAFAPHASNPGDTELPSLLGVLVAGGDNGKTELVDGCTWSSVWCRDDDELYKLRDAVTSTIAAWTGASVHGLEREWPEFRDGRWAVRMRVGGHRPMLEVYVPMYRDDLLPWRAMG